MTLLPRLLLLCGSFIGWLLAAENFYCADCWRNYGMNEEGDGTKEAQYMGHNLQNLYGDDDY
jgi:hypothetical protein